MKKLIALLTLAGMLTFAGSSFIYAQDEAQTDENTTEQVEETVAEEVAVIDEGDAAEASGENVPMHQQLKVKFIEGGPMWMAPLIICLILGLALAFERIIYLNFASTNTKNFYLKLKKL